MMSIFLTVFLLLKQALSSTITMPTMKFNRCQLRLPRKLVGDVTRKPEDVLPLDPEKLSRTIREVTLQTPDNSQFKPFLPTGNGNGGLRVYNVQQEPGTDEYTYVPVSKQRTSFVGDCTFH